MRNRFGGHQELQLVDAGGAVQFDGLEAAFRVAGDGDGTVGQGVGVELVPDGVGDLRRAAGQVHARVFTFFLLDVTGKIGFQVLGHAAPRFNEAFVHVDLVFQIGAVGPEKRFQRLRRQFARRLVVLAAKGHGGAEPLVVDGASDRLGLLHVFLEFLDVFGQGRGGGDAQRHDADALLSRQPVGRRLQGRHPDGRVRLLVRLGSHVARRHVPETAFPLEQSVFPDFGNHGQRFFPHVAGVAWVDAHARLLVGRRASGAEVNPAAGHVVDHGNPFRHSYGVVVRENDDAESEPDAFGQTAQRPEDGLGTRGHRKAGEKVVFHEPDGVETHFVGQNALLNRFFDHGVVVNDRPLHFVRQAQFHDRIPLGVASPQEKRNQSSDTVLTAKSSSPVRGFSLLANACKAVSSTSAKSAAGCRGPPSTSAS